MSKVVVIGVFTATLLLAGQLALVLDVTSAWIAPEQPSVLEPDGGFWTAVIGALEYVWNAVGSMMQLMAFQADGVPAALIMVMDMMIFFILISLIRGGS